MDDRDPAKCESNPCAAGWWCGPGAAEGSTYVEVLQFTPIVGSTVIKQKKTFTLFVTNVALLDDTWIYLPSPPNPKDKWFVFQDSQYRLKSDSTHGFPVIIDSSSFDNGFINQTVTLQWTYFINNAPDPFTFNLSVPISISVFSLIISPPDFSYSVLRDDPTALSPPIAPIIEVFNTLCSNSITYKVAPVDCDGTTALPSWLALTDENPFADRFVDVQSGVSSKVAFALNGSELTVKPFALKNRNGTSAAVYSRTCLQLNLTLNGLDATIIRNINVSLRQLRPCPPGTYSLTGDDSDGCIPCNTGTYQSKEGQTFCERCSENFPQTFLSGAVSDGECVVDKGAYLTLNGTREECPVGADCSEVGVSVTTLRLRPGYWRTNPLSSTIVECPISRVSFFISLFVRRIGVFGGGFWGLIEGIVVYLGDLFGGRI